MKIVEKGWGYEKWICNSSNYCGKLLFFNAGMKCSYHYHKIKDETFYVQSGELKMTYGYKDDFSDAKTVILKKGDKFYIPPGLRHMMEGITDVELFEFSTEHFEDDSYRIVRGD